MTQYGVDYSFRTDDDAHLVRVRSEQYVGRVYVWVDGELIYRNRHKLAFGLTEHFTFTINDVPPKMGRVEVRRKALMPLVRPAPWSTYIDGKLMKTEMSAPLESSRNGIGPLGKTGLLE